MKYYWDFYGEGTAFKCVEAKNNVLGRELYPLPHQPSIRKKFYDEHLEKYLEIGK